MPPPACVPPNDNNKRTQSPYVREEYLHVVLPALRISPDSSPNSFGSALFYERESILYVRGSLPALIKYY
jgi:hypothetical protein